jgi:hypothetical protein
MLPSVRSCWKRWMRMVFALGLWKRLEMQLVLKGFVEMFKGVVVNVYQSDGGRKVGKTVYEGRGVEVNLLQWNMTIDGLVKKW